MTKSKYSDDNHPSTQQIFTGDINSRGDVSFNQEANVGGSKNTRNSRKPYWLVTISVIVAAVSGIASNIIASFIQDHFNLINDDVRILLVFGVFFLMLVFSIWIGARVQGE